MSSGTLGSRRSTPYPSWPSTSSTSCAGRPTQKRTSDAVEPGSTHCIRALAWNLFLQELVPGDKDNAPWMAKTEMPSTLTWEHRRARMVEYVRRAAPDIALFSELSRPRMWDDLCADLGPEFEGRHVANVEGAIDGADKDFHFDTALMWRKSVFQLQRARHVSLAPFLDSASRAVLADKSGQVPDVEAFALLATLKHQSGAVILAVSVHLNYEYTVPKRAMKCVQAEAVVNMVHKEMQQTKALAVIVAGDFNSSPDGVLSGWKAESHVGTYYIVTHNELSHDDFRHPRQHGWPDFQRPLRNPMPLRSAYNEASGHEPKYTRKLGNEASEFCLDYILIGGALRSISADAMPYETGGAIQSLPNETHPSDHLPILVTLQLTAPA